LPLLSISYGNFFVSRTGVPEILGAEGHLLYGFSLPCVLITVANNYKLDEARVVGLEDRSYIYATDGESGPPMFFFGAQGKCLLLRELEREEYSASIFKV
jgi:hypothetical protein